MQSLEFLRILQVVCGIGLVVFVHELGHFLAARLCKVRVEVFSLGIGPRLFGWRRGDTLYQIAALPLGGYCRMAGEERRWDGLPPQPDDLPAKSVEARFFIYSAGVLMNVAFVLVTYPILFSIGVPFLEPRIGGVAPGSPAWEAGVEPEMEVLAVNGTEVYEFNQIPTEVILGGGSAVRLLVQGPADGAQREFVIQPELDEVRGFYVIGVESAIVRADGYPVLDVSEGTPAYVAGLRGGELLLGVEGGVPGLTPREQLENAISTGQPAPLRVRDDAGERTVLLTPEAMEGAPEQRRVGIRPPRNHVVGVRAGSVAAAIGLLEDDRLLAVNGRAILRNGDLQLGLLERVDSASTFSLLRGVGRLDLEGPVLSEEAALALANDLALRVDVENAWITIQPDEAGALAGLRDGDRVLEVNGAETAVWQDIFDGVQMAATRREPVRFRVERQEPGGGPPSYPLIEVEPKAVPPALYGIAFQSAQYTYQSPTAFEAIRFGFYSSWQTLEDMWASLKRLVDGSVSARQNLGGPIAIAQVSYTVAGSGWSTFFFFLCFISMNLAVLNVLPIPVLDGGHLFFLIVEKIKGSPVSDRVLGYSQMVGVVLLLSLMVFVTYNDIVRMIP